jgi:hypothetical protein
VHAAHLALDPTEPGEEALLVCSAHGHDGNDTGPGSASQPCAWYPRGV